MKLIKSKEYRLEDLPVGLFLHGDTLCMKTEYRTEQGAIEAYIVSSGEFFWGGATPHYQPKLMVTSLKVDESIDIIDDIPYVPFPIAFHTVDVIAVNSKGEILLGKKPKSDKWVFIGGFVEPTHTAEHTASKEFSEEACVLIQDESRFKYLGSYFIDDSRFKDTCHKITTSLFTINLTDEEASSVAGGDDIEVVKWFKKEEILDNLKELHQELFAVYLAI
jgi:ADP-ribose pyrophosphatase YjhB (NUDIX family)